LNEGAILGDQLPAYREQRSTYTPLASTLLYLREYLSGKSSYEQFQSRMKAWSSSGAYTDSVNQKARTNLLSILQGVQDPELQEKAKSAAIAIRANTKEVSSPSAPAKGETPQKAPAPTEATALTAPPKSQPKSVVAFDFKKTREAQEEQERLLSNTALGWSEESRKKYAKASLAIIRVRDYVAGRGYDQDSVRAALVAWRMDENFNKDPVMKATYAKLTAALSTLKVDVNVRPGQTAGTLMNEVNGSVGALESKPAPEAPKNVEAPKKEAPKPPPPPAPKAAPQPAPKPEPKPAPKPAPVAPVAAPAAVAKGSESLTDGAVFGDKVGEWNQPSVKAGSHLALNSSLLALREFVDGKSSYTTLKSRLSGWEGSPAYNTALSERARSNMISILKGMDGEKAKSALVALNGTKVPTPPIPAQPVAIASLEKTPSVAAAGQGSVTEEEFRDLRLKIATREHKKAMENLGKVFDFSAEVYVSVKPETGEVTKVNYKNVSAVRAGDTGPNVTNAEVENLLMAMAGAYRSEVKFGKNGKPTFGFRLDLKATKGSEAPTPVSAGKKKEEPVAPPLPSAPPPPPAKVGQSTYTFNVGSQPTPSIASAQSANGMSAAFQNAGTRAVNGYGKKSGQGLKATMETKVFLDPKGYVQKVEFINVNPEEGISNGPQMQELLNRFASNLRSSLRGEANGELHVKKTIIQAT